MTEKDELMLKGEDADGAATVERHTLRERIAPPFRELTLSTEAQPSLGAEHSSPHDEATSPIAALPAAIDDRPHLLVLCGVVGSGKSSFAQSLCSLQRPRYIRASQDVLGDRQSVISLVSQNLAQRRNVVVDRTNADASQRAYWLDLGQQYGAETDIIVFDTPFSTCQARLRARKDHETLKSPAQALNVLRLFTKQWRMPTMEEGFEHLLVLHAREEEEEEEEEEDESPKRPDYGHAEPAQFWSEEAIMHVLQQLQAQACPAKARDKYVAEWEAGGGTGGAQCRGSGRGRGRGRGDRSGRGRGASSGDVSSDRGRGAHRGRGQYRHEPGSVPPWRVPGAFGSADHHDQSHIAEAR
ncbi:P-loop containing nucleoside triphosphate hydrolase protein [Ceraceosorus guamensis]|uniref:P-loop containing nucleoside triphosphate hydrolase protein n=1 Tax=Ceraceosorus guamensis TaxID=1522189 RepID=A0A316VWC5_9BASI|nr:P-loop containing nucleoside triphosphate hydrolase protein [Ceraceosorus guamensis]PWN41248.1 P-loop containing nucleoside triphosphate hydrolase protein [Ceraceosorus guamensis]